MPVRKVGRYPLIQTRMWIGTLTFPDMGSMRCQYIFILSKLINVVFLISIIMCGIGNSAARFLEMIIANTQILLYGTEFGQNEFLVMLYVRSSRFLQRQVM